MNRYIIKLTLSAFLLNIAPLHPEYTFTSVVNSARNSITNLKSTLSSSQGYRIAAGVMGAFTALLLGSYVVQKCTENSKSRFMYLSNQEFIILTQQLVLSIDTHLEPLENAIEQFEAISADSEEYEIVRERIYELFYSSKIMNTNTLCHELLDEVKIRENNTEQSHNNSEFESLNSLKTTLNKQLELLEKSQQISKPLICSESSQENDVDQSWYYPHHNSWHRDHFHHNYWHHNNNSKCQNTAANATQSAGDNKTVSPSPALVDTIPNITTSDILLSSFS